MKNCSKSHYILLLIYITSFPALEAQKVKHQPKVTGYLKHDVTLPCQFVQGPQMNNITQFQWDFHTPEGEKLLILVSNSQHGLSIHDTFLKDRVELTEQSLIIRNVNKADAGSYSCSVTVFPSGLFEGTIKLVVQEQIPLSSGVVAAIVITVMLLLVIMAATAYLIFTRRHDSAVRHRVYIDKDGPVMDVARLSVLNRDEDVVYSDVKFEPSREVTALFNDKHTDTMHADDVTYSEVIVMRPQPK